MRYFSRFSPVAALRDLGVFFAARKKHELWFLACAAALTAGIILAFIKDSMSLERPYKREIIYVQQWPANRTDAEILADRARDAPRVKAEREKLRRAQEARRAEFKKVDDALTRWGL